VEETADGLVYRAVVPMPASQNFMGRDCLKCHEAREGSVLGAVSLQIGLDQVRQAGRDFQRSAFLAAALFGALIVGALYLLCSRTVSRPLAEAAAQLRDISEGDGDLTKRLRVRSRDEVGELGAVFNVFADKLHGVMVDVRRASDHASGVAHQLSAASEQLAAGAQEQASSLEETAASLEEITGTVKQNADNARQANQLAAGSREVAEKGGQVVRDAMASMSEINRSSKKIADIITTIDEIAFQTNLLALNAAVEAARAGEQGRGFAVVASEVRNLAQRSATAAKEIKGLIQDSVQKVEAGSELVNKSGETLNEIVGSVKRVTDIIAEIAAASQEQSTGIDQVNKAVTQMDQVTQSNAAQTEELSSTAQSLATQAEQLQGLVARFKLDDGAAHTGAAPSTTALAPKASPVRSMPTPVVRAPKRPPADPALVSAHTPNGNSSPHAGNDGFEEF
jgi:methyl-accepting chemotaxis protein